MKPAICVPLWWYKNIKDEEYNEEYKINNIKTLLWN